MPSKQGKNFLDSIPGLAAAVDAACAFAKDTSVGDVHRLIDTDSPFTRAIGFSILKRRAFNPGKCDVYALYDLADTITNCESTARAVGWGHSDTIEMLFGIASGSEPGYEKHIRRDAAKILLQTSEDVFSDTHDERCGQWAPKIVLLTTNPRIRPLVENDFSHTFSAALLFLGNRDGFDSPSLLSFFKSAKKVHPVFKRSCLEALASTAGNGKGAWQTIETAVKAGFVTPAESSFVWRETMVHTAGDDTSELIVNPVVTLPFFSKWKADPKSDDAMSGFSIAVRHGAWPSLFDWLASGKPLPHDLPDPFFTWAENHCNDTRSGNVPDAKQPRLWAEAGAFCRSVGSDPKTLDRKQKALVCSMAASAFSWSCLAAADSAVGLFASMNRLDWERAMASSAKCASEQTWRPKGASSKMRTIFKRLLQLAGNRVSAKTSANLKAASPRLASEIESAAMDAALPATPSKQEGKPFAAAPSV